MGLKPMNCPAHTQLYELAAPLLPRPADPLLRAGPRAPPRAVAARCTACCASATSRRTTRTSSAPRTRSRKRSSAASSSASRSTTGSASSRGWSSPPAPRSGSAPRRCGTSAEAALQSALDNRGLEYEVNEGDGAFYGPKIDLHMTDAIGRSWQLGTVQLDYVMPERFELTYTGADNAEHRPVMIHRALMGSFERFIGMLSSTTPASSRSGWRRSRRSCCRSPTATSSYARRGRRPTLGELPRRGRRAARSRSGARSARRSCARSPTCSCVGDREVEARHGRRCAATARATRARCRSTSSARSWPRD